MSPRQDPPVVRVPRPRTRPGGHRDGGFTLVEVLVSVTIFAIAASGLLAMLLVAVRANATAGDASAAVGIAERFLERLRFRAAGWTGMMPLETEAPDLYANGQQNTWMVPLASSGSPWSDGLPHDAEGRVLGATDARKAIFCVHYRTTWLPAGTAVDASNEVLVTVRVAYTADGSESWRRCDVADVDAALTDGSARAVILPTTLREQPL